MPIHGVWKNAVIANGGTISTEVDLGLDADYMNVIFPTLTSCTIKVTVCDDTSGTFQDLGNGVTTATTVGGYSTTFKTGSYKYIKLVSSVAQGAERTIKVRGIKT